MHYKDLIAEISADRGELPNGSAAHMSQLLTQINLDARFVHMGKGYWGLRDWASGQQKSTPVVIPGEADYQPKAEDYRFVDDEDDHDDESELLVPVVDEDEVVFSDEDAEALSPDDDDQEEDE